MPWQRISSVAEMKFNVPNNCPTQKMAIETAHRTWPVPCPGPATSPSALRGHEKRGDGHQECAEGHPERQHVEARKRHVLGAHLDGQEIIAETRQRRGGQHEEDHDGPMHGHQLQVVLWSEDTTRRAVLGE
jgi:hypothetical protein